MLSYALAVAVLATGALGSDWTYNRCATLEPPTEWPDTCGTQVQGSPINICGAQAFNGTAPVPVATGYDIVRNITIVNNGHTVQIASVTDGPTMQFGTLAALVGRGNASDPLTWKLEQAHFHWGRTDRSDEGSEHYIQGTRYPLEIHLVHFNTAAGATLAAALGSGRRDAALVVGVMFQLGASDVDLISIVGPAAHTAGAKAAPVSTAVRFSDVFDGTGAFYSYAGSLTTPPCTEAVTWVVMKDPKTVKLETLTHFKEATATPTAVAAQKFAVQSAMAGDLISKYGNFRPLQPLNGRKVFVSAGASATCVAPTEPTFLCGAAGLRAGPLLLTVPALLLLLWR